jgi:hypothetical protein
VKFSTWMLGETGRMFALWHAFKRGHVDRQTLVRKSIIIRGRMSRCLQLYGASSDCDVARKGRK